MRLGTVSINSAQMSMYDSPVAEMLLESSSGKCRSSSSNDATATTSALDTRPECCNEPDAHCWAERRTSCHVVQSPRIPLCCDVAVDQVQAIQTIEQVTRKKAKEGYPE